MKVSVFAFVMGLIAGFYMSERVALDVYGLAGLAFAQAITGAFLFRSRRYADFRKVFVAVLAAYAGVICMYVIKHTFPR